MVYHSKKDVWIVALVVLCVVLSLAAGLYFLIAEHGQALGRRWFFSATLAGFLILLFTYPLRYVLDETELRVRSGVLSWRVPLDGVEEVYPEWSFTSAPAWSADRLAIRYVKRGRPAFIYISPAGKEEFLQDLASKTPHLRLVDGRLSRA